MQAKPGEHRVYPPITKQVGNAIEAAGRLAAAWFTGQETTVDSEEATRRLAICMECSKFDHAAARCVLCGCSMPLKARLATEHCPLPESEGGPKW